jgi:hypothetical protein
MGREGQGGKQSPGRPGQDKDWDEEKR